MVLRAIAAFRVETLQALGEDFADDGEHRQNERARERQRARAAGCRK